MEEEFESLKPQAPADMSAFLGVAAQFTSSHSTFNQIMVQPVNSRHAPIATQTSTKSSLSSVKRGRPPIGATSFYAKLSVTRKHDSPSSSTFNNPSAADSCGPTEPARIINDGSGGGSCVLAAAEVARNQVSSPQPAVAEDPAQDVAKPGPEVSRRPESVAPTFGAGQRGGGVARSQEDESRQQRLGRGMLRRHRQEETADIESFSGLRLT